MAATQEDIRGWLLEGKAKGANHVIIVCDTFDMEDYPVHVQPGEIIQDEINKYNGKNMQKIMEVYNLALDIEEQLKEYRVWNI